MLQVTPGKRDKIIAAVRQKDALLIKTERGLLQIEPKRKDIIRIRYTHRQENADAFASESAAMKGSAHGKFRKIRRK